MTGTMSFARFRAALLFSSVMRSKSRLADVVTGKDVGKYGLGTDRTLDEYIKLTGIDYLTRTTDARAKNGQHVFNQDYRLPLNF